MYLARIYVTLKPAVNDPQGQTVMGNLKQMGYLSVDDVRMGKYLEVHVDEADRQRAQEVVDDMCYKLLANPVIEQYSFDLDEVAAVPGSSGG